MTAPYSIDPSAPLQFVINGASGSTVAEERREAIERVLAEKGRRGELHFCGPGEITRESRKAVAAAVASRTAVVAVGGDGSLNEVAQAAHAADCVMGVVAQGTFNYFARAHHLPLEPADAVRVLLEAEPQPLSVAAINDRIILVNASVGLYPDLLEDREQFKSRFGRNRIIALMAAFVTLLRAQRQLRLHIETGDTSRDVRALTLFVGCNHLQLERVGLTPATANADGSNGRDRSGPGDDRITAVTLHPVGTMALIGLMIRGAMGSLGEAPDIDHFEFHRMIVNPSRLQNPRGIKVAYDGEVSRMRPPLDFRVLDKPLHVLLPVPETPGDDARDDPQ